MFDWLYYGRSGITNTTVIEAILSGLQGHAIEQVASIVAHGGASMIHLWIKEVRICGRMIVFRPPHLALVRIVSAAMVNLLVVFVIHFYLMISFAPLDSNIFK